MHCSKDCVCSLCRELQNYERVMHTTKRYAPNENSVLCRIPYDNFILRGRDECGSSPLKAFQPQSLRNSEMFQKHGSNTITSQLYQRGTETPSPTPMDQLPDIMTPLLVAEKEQNISRQNTTDIWRNDNHKVVIYFGDSLGRCQQQMPGILATPVVRKESVTLDATVTHSLVLQEMTQTKKCNDKSEPSSKPKQICQSDITADHSPRTDYDFALPTYIERVQDGVINVKIKDSYQFANALVEIVTKPMLNSVSQPMSKINYKDGNKNERGNSSGTSTISSDNIEYDAETVSQCDSCDWSYVQEWRRGLQRPIAKLTSQITCVPAPPCQMEDNQSDPIYHQCDHGKATLDPRVIQPMAKQPTNFIQKDTIRYAQPLPALIINTVSQQSNDIWPQIAVAGPAHLTVRSTLVKSQPPLLSSSLQTLPNTPNSKTQLHVPDVLTDNKLYRMHYHKPKTLLRVQECHSSSDENRSSGHASMSDTGGQGSTSPPVGLTLGPLPEDRLSAGTVNRNIRSRSSQQHARPRHRVISGKSSWNGNGIEDVKLALQQLTLCSQTSTSTYSTLSSGSENSVTSRRLFRNSSVETVITSADEFVWVDSHNRLVELQYPPWNQACIMRCIRAGRCKEQADHISVQVVSRLGYLLQRALVRIAREIQRFSANLGLCSKHEVASAFKVVLCSLLADSCTKACLRAAAIFAVSGESVLKQSKSARAGLQLSVGRFYRWMTDARLGKFIHEYAAIYLCAGIENLLEEILLQCSCKEKQQLTVANLDYGIANSGDLWGLLQPFAHLNAGRIASGALTIPRWASQSSLVTCVGSINELKDKAFRLLSNFQHIPLSVAALTALFYFMRCSQLEHTEKVAQTTDHQPSMPSGNKNIQELCYERAFIVLPPLIEWLRVASAHAEYRNALIIDKDDIMQAARLLLPDVDCPIRPVENDNELPMKKGLFTSPTGSVSPTITTPCENTTELGRQATIGVAFKLLLTGRVELFSQAAQILPTSTRYNTQNNTGMTALMIASIRNDEVAIQALLDAGCDPNIEVPSVGTTGYSAIQADTQYWTAVTFAACLGNYAALRILLQRGGKAEGGVRTNEEKCTLTPLQVAAGTGNLEVVSLLLQYGANPFQSTQQKDTVCFAGSVQKGSFCAISVAAAHGHRSCLCKLLSHPVTSSRDVLSLEEMLAESDVTGRHAAAPKNGNRSSDLLTVLSKKQIKQLQEAMYHSAENNHLEITTELRNMGVPWTLHCWMHTLSAAHELCLDAVIDQLLQDFLQVCPDDYSIQFISDCLPLLFNIFRYSKNEGTTLLLADIFATCFGWDIIQPLKEPILQSVYSSRIDPKFVNNPELSDVSFRVESKVFYAHKIVLVTASPRFQNMLSSRVSDMNTPTVQINDIRYHIFQLVMQFLYNGGCGSLDVSKNDVIELMAAASFFQLDGLLHYTEARCSEIVDIDNVVAMYIHAKVYNANNLLEYCQRFLLQNMVALLTFDDSVKRLLFAKKIPNHDVIAGLLQALQNHLKQRQPNLAFPTTSTLTP